MYGKLEFFFFGLNMLNINIVLVWYWRVDIKFGWSLYYTHYMLCRVIQDVLLYIMYLKWFSGFVWITIYNIWWMYQLYSTIRKRETICHCQVGCQPIRKCWISGFATFVMICLSSNCVCSESMYTLGSIIIYQRYLIACFPMV